MVLLILLCPPAWHFERATFALEKWMRISDWSPVTLSHFLPGASATWLLSVFVCLCLLLLFSFFLSLLFPFCDGEDTHSTSKLHPQTVFDWFIMLNYMTFLFCCFCLFASSDKDFHLRQMMVVDRSRLKLCCRPSCLSSFTCSELSACIEMRCWGSLSGYVRG